MATQANSTGTHTRTRRPQRKPPAAWVLVVLVAEAGSAPPHLRPRRPLPRSPQMRHRRLHFAHGRKLFGERDVYNSRSNRCVRANSAKSPRHAREFERHRLQALLHDGDHVWLTRRRLGGGLAFPLLGTLPFMCRKALEGRGGVAEATIGAREVHLKAPLVWTRRR